MGDGRGAVRAMRAVEELAAQVVDQLDRRGVAEEDRAWQLQASCGGDPAPQIDDAERVEALVLEGLVAGDRGAGGVAEHDGRVEADDIEKPLLLLRG